MKYTIDVYCILVGFNEMIYNAIEHGNKFHPSKQVHIHIEIKEEFILIAIKDDGEGFNWRAGMKKQLDFMNFEERGRGIIFTKASFLITLLIIKRNIVYLFI
ncbi:ATP-binding protein [Anaerobacillus sp. HL2]|nr:ATP-binding protein [Anaerobacillus sp. HL2]